MILIDALCTDYSTHVTRNFHFQRLLPTKVLPLRKLAVAEAVVCTMGVDVQEADAAGAAAVVAELGAHTGSRSTYKTPRPPQSRCCPGTAPEQLAGPNPSGGSTDCGN